MLQISKTVGQNNNKSQADPQNSQDLGKKPKQRQHWWMWLGFCLTTHSRCSFVCAAAVITVTNLLS